MAERGVYLTATSLTKPSLFELIAQDSLTATFHPAAKRVAEFITSRYPEHCAWLLNWFDEVYLGFNCVLQLHYIKYNRASFAETFYGLQRVCERVGADTGVLPKRERFLSAFFLILFPYLRTKLEEVTTRYRIEEADGVVQTNAVSAARRRLLVNLYRVFYLVWEFWTVVQYLRYLSGRSRTHSPELAISGVTLCYAPELENDWSWSQMWQAFISGGLKLSIPSPRTVGSVLTHSLEVAAFFIQFLQWWNSEQTCTDITVLPTPDPPPVGEVANLYGGVCPICMKPWKIETLLSVSGLVFCYGCIRSHLNRAAECPVTHYPATIQDLVRIFPSQS